MLIVSTTVLWSADYYWIGGSGNWTDISHWATTSGGKTQQVTVPSFLDRVIFDENSFTAPGQSVTIVGEVFCAGMEWAGVVGIPSLSGTSSTVLNVYGDLLIADMQWSLEGKTILWEGGPTSRINSGSVSLHGELEVNLGTGNTLIQQSNLNVLNGIRVSSGNWNSGGYRIQSSSIIIEPVSISTLDWQNSTIQFSGTINELVIQSDLVQLNSQASAILMGGNNCKLTLIGDAKVALATFYTTDAAGSLTINNKSLNGSIPNLSFTNLTLGGNATFRGPIQMDRFELTGGHSYTFAATNWYSLSQLVAVGTCDSPILLNSDKPGVSATLHSDQSQSVEFVRIQDIEAEGGPFTAGNSSGLGITKGWLITNPSGSKILYWVNGKGDWNDSYHWSLTSGGNGGACTPSGSDDVIFDARSFTTNQDSVIIPAGTVECNNMLWDGVIGNPVFYGAKEVSINLYGALQFDPGMKNAFFGSIAFQSSTRDNAIEPAGSEFFGPVKFNGTGSWELKSKMVSKGILTLTKGELDLAGWPVDVQGIESTSYEIRRLKLGNSSIRLNSWSLQFSGLTLYGDLAGLTFWGGNAIFFNVGISNSLHLHSLTSEAEEITLNRFGNLDIRIDQVAIKGRGIFLGSHHFGILQLGSGQHYSFGNGGASFYLDQLQVSGSCSGRTILESSEPGSSVYFKITSNQTVSMVSVRDVVVEGGNIQASSSVDEGNTAGWSFEEDPARTLYWVGGDGLWEDPLHWSVVSGGSPGECIPTAKDNVIFDSNSFSISGQSVRTDRKLLAQCFDFTWNNPVAGVVFDLPKLEVHHSIHMNGFADWTVETLRMMGDAPDMVIALDTFYTQTVELLGHGTWTLGHDLYMRALEAKFGHLVTADYAITGNTFRMYNQVKIELGQSSIWLDGAGLTTLGTFHVNAEEVDLDAGQSQLILTHVGAQVNLIGKHQLYHVLFNNPAGNATLKGDRGGNYQRVEFYGSGRIEAENTFDSLLFNAGRTYVLESEKVQTIKNYWRIIGTPCTFIILRATESGKRSIVSMAQGQVSGDNLILRDQETRGGATFFAGRNSIDASNNQGWEFDRNHGVTLDGLLGADLTLCSGQTLQINTVDLIGAQRYLWNDSITTPYLEVHNPGQVTLYAYFGQNCEYRDTLVIKAPEGLQFDLGADTASICEGSTYLLDISVSDPDASYAWGDGSTDPIRSVSAAGTYRATVSAGGCTQRDSIYLEQIILPQTIVDTLFTVCSNDSVVIQIDAVTASFTWSDGSVGPEATFQSPGWYWVDVQNKGCFNRDSFRIRYPDSMEIHLGNDTLICGHDFTLNAPDFRDAVYLWNDGQTTPTIHITTSGVYSLSMTRDGCITSDTIQVTLSTGMLELPDTISYCAGEAKIIDLGNLSPTVRWSDGGVGPVHALNTPGMVWVSIEMDGCMVADTFLVVEKGIPIVTLPKDTLMCPGEIWSFDASALLPAILQWENGSLSAFHSLIATKDTQIVLSAELEGCKSMDSILVTVKPLPEIDLGRDTTLCYSIPLELTVQTSGTTLLWDDGSSDVFRQVDASGIYWAEADLNGCKNRDSVQVLIMGNELPYHIPDTVLCNGAVWELSVADVPATDYMWSDGTSGAFKEISDAGKFVVRYVIGACLLTDTFLVRTEVCGRSEVYIPNLFSPDGDGINDYFTIYADPGIVVRSFRMQVLDRWGSMVADIHSMEPGWDGQTHGRTAPPGTYIYRIVVDYEEEGILQHKEFTGDLTLLR